MLLCFYEIMGKPNGSVILLCGGKNIAADGYSPSPALSLFTRRYTVKTLLVNHLCSILVLLSVTTGLCQAVEINRGMMLSHSCAGCHGTDGKSPGSIPSIEGKSAEFISKSLLEFREGKRSSTVMGRHAKGYSDEEIKLIANHFAAVK